MDGLEKQVESLISLSEGEGGGDAEKSFPVSGSGSWAC